MLTLNGIDDIKARIGQELGVSDWHLVTQEEINHFADVTGDHQWIHVDVERAKRRRSAARSRTATTRSRSRRKFTYELFSVEGFAFGINYGVNKVRFPAPLPVGGKVRMRAAIASVDDVPGGIQMATALTFEVEGGAKPVCVAETLARLYTG